MARVLIIEDDPHLGAELGAELEIRGHEVSWVRDAEAGAPRDDGFVPDVAVIDYFLPLGDGIDLVRLWKTRRLRPAVILLSGADVESEVRRRLSAHERPDRLFAKPIGVTVLVTEINRLAPGSPPVDIPAAPVGDLGGQLLPEVLWRLSRHHASGTLEIRDAEFTATVHVLNGDPVFVESGTLNETLGRLLLSRQLLSHEQFGHALSKVADDLHSGDDVRFGEVVVQLGYASADIVIETLREQVREKLVNLFHRPRPHTMFREGKSELTIGGAFRVDAAEVIHDGILRHFGAAQLENLLHPHLPKYIGLTASFDEHRRRYRFAPREERFLVAISGSRGTAELMDSGGLDRVHAMQLLVVLLTTDAVEFAEQPLGRRGMEVRPAASPKHAPKHAQKHERPPRNPAREEILIESLRSAGRTYYEVLGVRPDASRQVLEAACQRMSERFAPARIARLPLGDAHERATGLLARVKRAREVLTDPDRRSAYDAMLKAHKGTSARAGEFAAEQAFQRGLRELAQGRPVRAMVEFAKARTHAPSEPEYACYEIWASCLCAVESGGDRAACGREARARMEVTLSDRRPRPRALHVLALACLLMNDVPAARRHLEAALRFDPSFSDAQTLLERLA